jgi:hypothetical protein
MKIFLISILFFIVGCTASPEYYKNEKGETMPMPKQDSTMVSF